MSAAAAPWPRSRVIFLTPPPAPGGHTRALAPWLDPWLEARAPAEEILLVGATLDAANDLARSVVQEKRAAFGWHRLTLSSLAAAIAQPALATRGPAPLSRIATDAIVARLVHRLSEESGLGRYDAIAATPGFPRAVAGALEELRLARLPPDTVGAVAPDLVPLIGALENELNGEGLTDWSGVLALATESMADTGVPRGLVCPLRSGPP